MSHLSDAILRRYIDEPDALLSFEKEHLLQCAACRNRLTRYREHAAVAAAALPGAAQIDMEAARRGILIGVWDENDIPAELWSGYLRDKR